MELVRPVRIVLVGEAMLELSPGEGGSWRMGYGGDTLNTAIHLARLGHDVAYLTALGADQFSAGLRADWAAEGIDAGLILTDPDRQPGLYAIATDAAGERSFTYWRNDSAARRLFELPATEAVVAAAAQADLLVFSLISLAILPPAGQAALLALARAVRARGGKVAFDGNYRPRLWADGPSARAARDAALAGADIGLPTLEDEAALTGAADAEAVAREWGGHGVDEVVVKLGAEGCLCPDGHLVAPPEVLRPLDTSGAGDAFNAGYLHARMAGAPPGEAAMLGHRLAGWVVLRRGAVPARDDAAPYAVSSPV